MHVMKAKARIVLPKYCLEMKQSVILQMMMLSVGCGIIVSSCTTKYRDLTHAVCVVEWSENVKEAFFGDEIIVTIEKIGDSRRNITIEGWNDL